MEPIKKDDEEWVSGIRVEMVSYRMVETQGNNDQKSAKWYVDRNVLIFYTDMQLMPWVVF